MKIILTNGTELNPILDTGGQRFVQGRSRDTLSFIFPASAGLEALDAVFTAENCETITIVEDSGPEHIHRGYVIRAELTKAAVEVSPATADATAVWEDRITVSMSQRTYVETQLAENTEKSKMLEECLVEMAGIVYA